MEPNLKDREHRVLDALHRAAVFCDQKVGWNRIGVVLSFTIIAIAAVVLYRILRWIKARDPAAPLEPVWRCARHPGCAFETR